MDKKTGCAPRRRALVLERPGRCASGRGTPPGQATESSNLQDQFALLFVAPERLDFGETWEDRRFRWTLPIENRGEIDVHISEFVRSCSCAEVTPRSVVIPAGETREVTLSLELKPPHFEQSSNRPLYRFETEIVPKIENGGRGDAGGWKVHGVVKRTLNPEQREVDFGRWSECGGPLPVKVLSVRSLIPLRGVAARTGAAFLTARMGRRDASSTFELRVEGRERMPPGSFEAEILLVPETAEGAQLPAMTVHARGTVVPDVESSPPAVLLGARGIGECCREVLVLQSLTGQSLRLRHVKVSGQGLTAAAVEPARGERIELSVKQEIEQQGSFEGKVEVEVERQDGKSQSLVIPVTYLGSKQAAK